MDADRSELLGEPAQELLDVPAFKMRLVAASAHTDRRLRWVHVTELVDPRPYLKGGELVLTVGSSLTSPDRCRAFVANLVAGGAQALGLGLGDVVPEVPRALVEACEAADLPLFEVPLGIPFQSISEFVAERRTAARLASVREAQRLADRLLQDMTQGRGMPELLEVITSAIGGSVEFCDGSLRWQAVVPDDAPPDPELLVRLGTLLAVQSREDEIGEEIRRQEAGRLLGLILAGKADPDVFEPTLSGSLLDTRQPLVVAAWPRTAAKILTSMLGPSAVAEVEEVTISFTGSDAQVRTLSTDAAIPCGIAELRPGDELIQAIASARAGLDISRRTGTTVSHRDRVSLAGLLKEQPFERLIPFMSTLLRPLLDHDAHRGTGLIDSLRAFLACDGSVNDAAQSLYLHPNSLRHRLRRIEELTGHDPRHFEDQTAFAIAIWAWDRRPRRT